MITNNQPKTIDPNVLYTPNSLAGILEVDVTWVKKNLIFNRACRFRKQGAVYLLLGKWVIEWAETDHTFPGEDE